MAWRGWPVEVAGRPVLVRIQAPDDLPVSDNAVAQVRQVIEDRCRRIVERVDWNTPHHVLGFVVVVDHREYSVTIRSASGLTAGLLTGAAQCFAEEDHGANA